MGNGKSKAPSSTMEVTDLASVVNGHKVVVVSKSYCPYCRQAKQVLGKFGIADIVVLELDQMSNGADLQAQSAQLSGVRTVPSIFIGGEAIGGCDSTVKLDKSGALKSKLEAAGAV